PGSPALADAAAVPAPAASALAGPDAAAPALVPLTAGALLPLAPCGVAEVQAVSARKATTAAVTRTSRDCQRCMFASCPFRSEALTELRIPTVSRRLTVGMQRNSHACANTRTPYSFGQDRLACCQVSPASTVW